MKTRVTHTDKKKGWLAVVLCLILVFSATGGLVTESVRADDGEKWSNPYVVETFIDEQGREISKVTVPGRPPAVKAAPAALPERHVAGVTLNLSNVPAFDWSYGCSATSAAMLFGYYDRTGYSDMYTGPTDGGICPMDNSTWGPGIGGSDGQCPLSATRAGLDERPAGSKGHVDDYWVYYAHPGPDPYVGNWTEHTHGDCTADFMGTSQSAFGNSDGATSFYYNGTGAPLVDYTGCEPWDRDGCHGMLLFAESRGYTVVTNYFQLIKGWGSNPALGFTFDMYKAEIDAGRPVLIQVFGHSMLGIGYDDPSTVYLHNTWDYDPHTMTWGGTYSGLQHYGVTVIELAPAAPSPPSSAPTLVSPTDDATVSGTSVTFEWEAVAGATTYWLLVDKAAEWGSPWFFYDEVGAVLSCIVPGFPNDGTEFRWRVWGVNAAGYGPGSAIWDFTNTAASPPSSAPTLVSPTDDATVPGTSVTFEWEAVEGATTYWLLVDKAEEWGSPWFFYDEVGADLSSIVPGFPDDGTTFRWRVWGANAAGYGPGSAIWDFTNTAATPPSSAPTLVSPTDDATVPGTSVTFEWEAVEGATTYWLLVGKAAEWGSPWFFYDEVGADLSCIVPGFPDDGTTFRWRVWGANAAGYGPGSAMWDFTNTATTPPSSAPTLVAPADDATVSGTSVTFEWEAVEGATTYWLLVGKAEEWGSPWFFYEEVGTDLSCIVPGFPDDGTKFRWRVWGANAGGFGPGSAIWDFTNGIP